jgi:hypothetical protein
VDSLALAAKIKKHQAVLAAGSGVLTIVTIALLVSAPGIVRIPQTLRGRIVVYPFVSKDRAITITPTIRYPSTVARASNLQIELELRRSEAVLEESVRVDFRDGGYAYRTEKRPYSDLTDAEKDRVDEALKHAKLRASVSMAGVEISPSSEVEVPIDGSFVWSVRAKEQGHYSGRVILETAAGVYVASSSDLSISFDAVGTISFDTKTVLTALGALFLALIASLPNWIKLFQRDRGSEK